jgi:hypothetical protein
MKTKQDKATQSLEPDSIFRKAASLIHAYHLWGGLSPDDRERLKNYWALLDTDERQHMAEWCEENKGHLPNWLRIY